MKMDLYGKLKMNDNGEYIIDKTNLTKVLKKIYYSERHFLSITIESETRTLFKSKGELYFDKNDYGIWCWHVNGECLESVLFNHTEEVVYIIIDTNVEAEDAQDEIQELIYS
jgi:hypothetical protein